MVSLNKVGQDNLLTGMAFGLFDFSSVEFLDAFSEGLNTFRSRLSAVELIALFGYYSTFT
jgi:hypothetical protein